MDINFVKELYMPLIMVLCLAVGYILKHWVKDADNRIIPTTVAFLGVITACLSARGISLEIVVGGLVSGLASTGMHQVFKQMINGGE